MTILRSLILHRFLNFVTLNYFDTSLSCTGSSVYILSLLLQSNVHSSTSSISKTSQPQVLLEPLKELEHAPNSLLRRMGIGYHLAASGTLPIRDRSSEGSRHSASAFKIRTCPDYLGETSIFLMPRPRGLERRAPCAGRSCWTSR